MTNLEKIVKNQVDFQERIKSVGLNLVLCGNCGTAMFHELGAETMECVCGLEMELHTCSDAWYKGMEPKEDLVESFDTPVNRNDSWRCTNCNSFMGRHDMWFEGDLCGHCVDIVKEEEEELVDLFHTPELLPDEVVSILESFDDNSGNMYNECLRVCSKIIPLGYSFEFGLDGIPYNLIKI
jgi:ribosomal protein S27AE